MTTIQKPFVKGYKYRIYPTKDQIVLFEKTFGCVRYVWNKALADSKQEYEYYLAHKEIVNNKLVRPSLTGFSFVNKLVNYKNNPDSLWLNDTIAVSLQQTMLHLGSAFSTFFKRNRGYPKFKSKHDKQSFTLMSQSLRFRENKLYIPKSKEPLKVIWDRDLPNNPTSANISKSSTGKYYISFTCEYTPDKTNGLNKIGIDLGLKDFLVTSDGLKIANPKYTKQYEKKLKRLQQSLYRKTKGSKNRLKAKQRVALCHEKISNCRNDFLHKLSRTLVNENQVIGVEKLKVKNMIRNHKLAKAISDVAWSRFCEMLNYKVIESQHCQLVYMDCWFPSTHLCHIDDYKLDYKLKLSDRTWTCPQCNTLHDRDINAAKNILKHSLKTINDLNVPSSARIILAEA